MKKTLPLVLGVIVGWFAVAELYVPHWRIHVIQDHLLDFAQILSSAAFILGGINVMQVNLPKIRRRELDWHYKVVMLAGAVVMLAFGFKWQNIGTDPSAGQVEVASAGAAASPGNAIIVIDAAKPEAVVRIDGGAPRPAREDGKALAVEVAPGPHQVQVAMPSPVTGYLELDKTFDLAAGEVATAHAAMPMLWGPEGRLRTWVYNYIFFPCNATMFSLLAFFIASAGFRAFRARNTEAALLLGSAIIVLLGRAPIGRSISDRLPSITEWIVDVPNNAGRRAIIMGAALGGIVTGLRVILGLERSHLGSE